MMKVVKEWVIGYRLGFCLIMCMFKRASFICLLRYTQAGGSIWAGDD